MNQQNISLEWGQELASLVGQRVRKYRTDLNLSAQHLSNRTATLGYEVKRSVIAEMENGKRNTVALADVLVLARALSVPPIALIVPIEHSESFRLLPQNNVDAWSAHDWIIGKNDPFPIAPYFTALTENKELLLDAESYEIERRHWHQVSQPLQLQLRLEHLSSDYDSLLGQAVIFGIQAHSATESVLRDSYLRKIDDCTQKSQEVLQEMASVVGKLRKLGISAKSGHIAKIDEVFGEISGAKSSNKE